MSDTILLDKNLHYPVLIDEVLSIISPNNGGTFVDCTFGQGGYTKKILEFPKTKVIAFDRDTKSEIIAAKLKKNLKKDLNFITKNLAKSIKLNYQKKLTL